MKRYLFTAFAVAVAFNPKPVEGAELLEPKPVEELAYEPKPLEELAFDPKPEEELAFDPKPEEGLLAFNPKPEDEEFFFDPKPLEGVAYACACAKLTTDITDQYPVIDEVPALEDMDYDAFEFVEDSAQSRFIEWDNVVGVARGISVEDAKQIAASNPDISFFFWTKGGRLILEKPDGEYRRFRHGDTVFFSGGNSLGSAPGLADGYICL